MQRLAPHFSYSLSSDGEAIGKDSAYVLDAYQEDGKVKIMERIVPEATLPDRADIALEGYAMRKRFEEGDESFAFDIGGFVPRIRLDYTTCAICMSCGAPAASSKIRRNADLR